MMYLDEIFALWELGYLVLEHYRVFLEKILYAFLCIVVNLPRPTLHRMRMRTDRVEGFRVLAQVVYPLMGHMDFLSELERRYTGSQAGFNCAADRVRIFEIHGH
jgi:hypothetical protein